MLATGVRYLEKKKSNKAQHLVFHLVFFHTILGECRLLRNTGIHPDTGFAPSGSRGILV